MLTVNAGSPLIELLTLAFEANQPVLLHGRHGVGKSEVLAKGALQLGIDFISCDLSLMEPPDLVGIPRVGENGRTYYAMPAFLPESGKGLLVFEELNRCPRYMQAPCLQLLTARTLHDYKLPGGWLPCAAINDAGDGYAVEELDEALLSRFLRVTVKPDATEWIRWARSQETHPKIIQFVEHSPGVFDDPASNPRAWTYASTLLIAWERGEREQTLLATALAGVLTEKWALAFLQIYSDIHRPLQPEEIIDAYPAHQAALRTWVARRKLDVIAATVQLLQNHIQPQRCYQAIIVDDTRKANVQDFFADLPAELRRQIQAWLDDRGFNKLKALPRKRRPRR